MSNNFKRIFIYLMFGGGCTGLALLSTSFSSNNEKPDALLTVAEREKRITKIKSYGDIEAYGSQNGCVFRIVDKNERKDYSLSEFLTKKGTKATTLEKEVPKLAESAKFYCGKDTPIITFSYLEEGFWPDNFDIDMNCTEPNFFKLERTEIIRN